MKTRNRILSALTLAAFAAATLVATSAGAEIPTQLTKPDGKPADPTKPVAKFVLATGCGFTGREGFGLQIAEAQLAVGDARKHPEFTGNLKAVDSRDLWREADVSPKNQGYHYNRNAETYMEVGLRIGWAMAELLKGTK